MNNRSKSKSNAQELNYDELLKEQQDTLEYILKLETEENTASLEQESHSSEAKTLFFQVSKLADQLFKEPMLYSDTIQKLEEVTRKYYEYVETNMDYNVFKQKLNEKIPYRTIYTGNLDTDTIGFKDIQFHLYKVKDILYFDTDYPIKVDLKINKKDVKLVDIKKTFTYMIDLSSIEGQDYKVSLGKVE